MRFPHDPPMNATPNTSLPTCRNGGRNSGRLSFIQHCAEVLNLGLEFMTVACDFGPSLLGRDLELPGAHRVGWSVPISWDQYFTIFIHQDVSDKLPKIGAISLDTCAQKLSKWLATIWQNCRRSTGEVEPRVLRILETTGKRWSPVRQTPLFTFLKNAAQSPFENLPAALEVI
jgi:hypothetical protein